MSRNANIVGNNLKLSEIAFKYYDTFDRALADLAEKCPGGEETTLHFPDGSITIKLK